MTSRITSSTEWNAALAALPTPHVLQSWEWGAFKSRYGWRPERWLWQADDRPCAAASVLTRRLGRWPAAVSYVPKGPILDYGDSELLNQILSCLETTARRERALFVKIDPDVQTGTANGKAVVEALRRRGWRPSHEQIQFRNTMLLDLTRDPDEILAEMKSKWRYNIRLARRRGVIVRRSQPADLPLLYQIYAETATRDGFVIRPEAYYRDAWGSFIEAELAQPLIAEVAGEAVAMVITFRFPSTSLRTGDKRAWYMVGASRDIHREKMPNHLLQWEAMLWAREQGCTVYDMWGAPDVLDESDPLWGVYRFKQGFGGEFVEHIGAWDFPASRLGYWLYTRVMPRVLDAMRRVYWRRRT
jgi:peptidoglycan pentaglycine glycine transferase (the first glycine)